MASFLLTSMNHLKKSRHLSRDLRNDLLHLFFGLGDRFEFRTEFFEHGFNRHRTSIGEYADRAALHVAASVDHFLDITHRALAHAETLEERSHPASSFTTRD